MALDPYKMFLHHVPRLVNVVTLAEALPVPGSGLSLPATFKRLPPSARGPFTRRGARPSSWPPLRGAVS